MNDIWSTIRGMAWSLTHRLGIIDVILIVILSNILGLTSLNWLLLAVLQNGAIVLVVLFQPELRKALERMGRSRLITKASHRNADEDTEVIIEEIVQTVVDLSRRRVGALLVFERKTGLQDVVETGTMLNSEISAPLLENIFEPNTPLHDGAVVIRDDRVMAAACILPLAEASGVIRGLGTRHRAAVGITENTDAAVIVVSEQTGIVSFAADGTLKRPFTVEDIKAFLHEFYTSRASGIGSILRRLKKRFTEEKTA